MRRVGNVLVTGAVKYDNMRACGVGIGIFLGCRFLYLACRMKADLYSAACSGWNG